MPAVVTLGEMPAARRPAVDEDVALELAPVMAGPTVLVERCGCLLENVEVFGHRPGCWAYSVG